MITRLQRIKYIIWDTLALYPMMVSYSALAAEADGMVKTGVCWSLRMKS
jgi:hypothetical protein